MGSELGDKMSYLEGNIVIGSRSGECEGYFTSGLLLLRKLGSLLDRSCQGFPKGGGALEEGPFPVL
jgi:hypothetical protein